MKSLQINGAPILNFLDLQSQFSPLALYRELEAFERFAAIHCVPLSLQLTGRENGTRYNAEYLTKAFWQGLLRCVEWPAESMSAEDCLTVLLDRSLSRLAEGDEAALTDAREKLAEEAADAGLAEKLRFIERVAGAERDHRKTVLLLAVCELSEIDPRKTSANDWSVPGEVSGHASAVPAAGTEKNALASGAGPVFFPYDHTAYLTAGSQAYQYWYYDGEVLEPGAKIQTVRLEAKESGNQYAVVRIELYSESTGQCVQSAVLHSGEFRYCSVAQGRVIRFLPAISISDSLCLARSDYRKSDIRVIPKNGEDWILNAEHVSGFSAGGGNKGFILVQDGRINSKFYKDAEDHMVRLQLEMLMLPVIEARVCQEGYEILLGDGTTVSNLPGGGRTGVLTLNTLGRVPLPEVRGLSGVQEAALSETGRSAVALLGGSAGERVCFDGAGKAFQISKDGETTVFTW